MSAPDFASCWKRRYTLRVELAVRFILLCAGLLILPVQAAALTVPAPPDPGLENSIQNADLIVEADIISGGPFKAMAWVRKIYKCSIARPFGLADFPNNQVIRLTAFNSVNGDTAHGGLATGTHYLLFLSATNEPFTFSLLTPTAPRLLIQGDKILVPVGDPPAPVSVKKSLWDSALNVCLQLNGAATPDARKEIEAGVPKLLNEIWAQSDVESRYLAVSLAGIFRNTESVAMLNEAAQSQLLRLKLTTVITLKKINTSEARATLRAMLKDEKESVARASALALTELNDFTALEDLLAWAVRVHKDFEALPSADTRRAKVLDALGKVLLMAEDAGPLFDPEKSAPLLLDLAKSSDTSISSGALYVLGGMIHKEQMPALQELAEDPAFKNRRAALFALFRATLVPPKETGEQSALWKKALDPESGESWREDQVRAAASSLYAATEDQEKQYYRAILRCAPAEQALPALCGWWMKSAERGNSVADDDATLMPLTDLALWRSPLTLPLIVERLGSENDRERADALAVLAQLFKRYPRLGAGFTPLARAMLCDSVERVRNSAAVLVSVLNDRRSLPQLIQGLDPQGDGSIAAANAHFEISSRTLGFGAYEPLADLDEAFSRNEGWTLSESGTRFIQNGNGLVPKGFQLSTEDRENLLKAFPARHIRSSNAAFTCLVNGLDPTDPLWTKLLAENSSRSQAWGLAATLSGPEVLDKPVGALFGPSHSLIELVRGLTLLNLGTLSGASGKPRLTSWIKSEILSEPAPAKPMSLGMQRLAILSLGLGAANKESLELTESYAKKLLDAQTADESTPNLRVTKTLLFPALLAVAAQNGNVKILYTALESRTPMVREFALRALAAREDGIMNEQAAQAFAKMDAYSTPPLARRWRAKFSAVKPDQAAVWLRAETSALRLLAMIGIAEFPGLARAPEVRPALLTALEDSNSQMRALSARQLGILKDRSALSKLAVLLSDYNTEAAANAAQAIVEIGDADSLFQAAQAATRQNRIEMRWARAYGAGSGTSAQDFLVKLVRSDNWIDRRNGLAGLSASQTSEAAEKLYEIFRDPESIMRNHAEDALQDWVSWPSAAAARQDLFALIDQDLSSNEVSVRAHTLELLGGMADPEAVNRVLKQLDDPEESVRLTAQWAVNQFILHIDAGQVKTAFKPGERVRFLKQNMDHVKK